MEPDLQFEVSLLRRRLVSAWVAVAVVGLVLVAALVWSVKLQTVSMQQNRSLAKVTAQVDSLRSAARADVQRISPIEQRVESLGAFDTRIHDAIQGKADRARVAEVSDRIDALTARMVRTDSLVAALRPEFSRQVEAQADSLDTARTQLVAAIEGLRDTTRQQAATLDDTGLRLAALSTRVATSGRHQLIRDGITAVTAGVLVAHVASDR